MKLLIFLVLLLTCYCRSLFPVTVADLNESALASNIYTDHVRHFRKLFEKEHVHSFLEFGIGYGTKYFLDHCDEVTSCEILVPEQTAEWFHHTIELFHEYPNWIPLLKRVGSAMQRANQLAVVERKDPAIYDATYLLEIKAICDELCKNKHFDVAFVDVGFHMRGDLVNELFDRVPIIVAHDTNIAPEIYGWDRVYTPSNYQKIVFSEGQGVTMWIRKDKANLITALGEKLEPPAKKLRIFFPMMHHTLIKSMALALQHLGHTLVLPGKSFSPDSPGRGLKLTGTDYLSKNPLDRAHFASLFSKQSLVPISFLDAVEIIESDQMFSNPPDVLVVNWKGVEEGMYSLHEYLLRYSNKKDIKLLHYSGNNCTEYNKKYVKNLIAVDSCSASLYDASVQKLFWIPWIDFETLKFSGPNDAPIVCNFLSHYYDGPFKSSGDIFHDVTGRLKENLPSVSILSPPFGPRDEMLACIDQGCATFHIKESEGFGYTILESIAKGRPVFLKRSFSSGSRLMRWCIEGKTAFFFDDYAECEQKLKDYLEDSIYRHDVQEECARTVRALIDNEKQARILDHFLQNLK